MNLTNIQLGSNTAPGSPFTVNRYIDANSFKLVINGTGTDIFELTTGVSGATRRFAFASSGQYTMDAYGSGTFTGTETKWLAVTAAGLVIEKDPPSGSTITADNGLTMSTATNVQLFGTVGTPATLLHDSYLDATSSYKLFITGAIAGSTNYIFNVENTSVFGGGIVGSSTQAGNGVKGISSGGYGVLGSSTNGPGGSFTSSTVSGVEGISITGVGGFFQVIPSSTNTSVDVVKLVRNSSGTAADGIGGILDYSIQVSDGTTETANQLISKWTTANQATRTSQFIITGVDSAVTADLLTIYGSGQHQFNKYGSGTFTGTDVYWLAVTSAGLIIEKTPPSAGTDTNFAITDLTSTGDRVHTFGADTCQITFNSLAGDSGLKLTSTSTAAASSLQKVLEVSLSGANSNSGQTTYAIYADNGHTGTTAIDYAIYGNASRSNSSDAGVYGNGTTASNGVIGNSSGTGAGVLGITSSGNALEGRGNSGKGLSAQSTSSLAGYFQINPSSTNTIVDVIQVTRLTSGSTANGIGGKITFINEADDGFGYESAGIAGTWGDVTLASRSGTLRNFVISAAQNVERYSIFGTYKALTEASATSFVRINIPSGEVAGGQMIVTVQANDASDFQSRTLRYIWSAVNKSGTISVTLSTPEEVFAESAGGSTLSVTIDTNDAGSGNLDFRANATSSLTQTTLRIAYQVWKNYGTGATTPQ